MDQTTELLQQIGALLERRQQIIEESMEKRRLQREERRKQLPEKLAQIQKQAAEEIEPIQQFLKDMESDRERDRIRGEQEDAHQRDMRTRLLMEFARQNAQLEHIALSLERIAGNEQ